MSVCVGGGKGLHIALVVASGFCLHVFLGKGQRSVVQLFNLLITLTSWRLGWGGEAERVSCPTSLSFLARLCRYQPFSPLLLLPCCEASTLLFPTHSLFLPVCFSVCIFGPSLSASIIAVPRSVHGVWCNQCWAF
jgi:hypothetical protein